MNPNIPILRFVHLQISSTNLRAFRGATPRTGTSILSLDHYKPLRWAPGSHPPEPCSSHSISQQALNCLPSTFCFSYPFFFPYLLKILLLRLDTSQNRELELRWMTTLCWSVLGLLHFVPKKWFASVHKKQNKKIDCLILSFSLFLMVYARSVKDRFLHSLNENDNSYSEKKYGNCMKTLTTEIILEN